MEIDKLEQAKILQADIEYLNSLVSDLKHVNSNWRPNNPDYWGGKKSTGWRLGKLFQSATIEKSKDSDSIRVEPKSIGGFYFNIWELKDVDLRTKLGRVRANTFKLMAEQTIVVLEEAKAKLKKL